MREQNDSVTNFMESQHKKIDGLMGAISEKALSGECSEEELSFCLNILEELNGIARFTDATQEEIFTRSGDKTGIGSIEQRNYNRTNATNNVLNTGYAMLNEMHEKNEFSSEFHDDSGEQALPPILK